MLNAQNFNMKCGTTYMKNWQQGLLLCMGQNEGVIQSNTKQQIICYMITLNMCWLYVRALNDLVKCSEYGTTSDLLEK